MKGIVPSSDAGHDFDLIAEMTEPASIGFVAGRMKQALEEKVCPALPPRLTTTQTAVVWIATSVDGSSCGYRLLYADCKRSLSCIRFRTETNLSFNITVAPRY